MAEDHLKGRHSGVVGAALRLAGIGNASALRLALNGFCIVATLALLSFGFASPTRAACPPGYGICNNLPGRCYPLGSTCCEDGAYQAGAQCCQGGGACAPGNQCWGDANNQNFCCPSGQQGYKDRGCAPPGISDYCGREGNTTYYCTTGRCVWSGDRRPSAAKCQG